MGTKLTLEQVYYWTWRMWDYLAETGKFKLDFYRRYPDVPKFLNNCPCCEYLQPTAMGGECLNCPMMRAWDADNVMTERQRGYFPCEGGERSPYMLWTRSLDVRKRKEYAQAIADIALEKYRQLKQTQPASHFLFERDAAECEFGRIDKA